MADAKLTALTAASALAAADLFYVSQSAASRKATGTQLLALVGTAYVPLAGGTMTGALTIASGTLTASAPGLNITQTWNQGATVFTGVLWNFTNTASSPASLPLDIQLNGSSIFKVERTGGITTGGNVYTLGATLSTGSGVRVGNANSFQFSSTAFAYDVGDLYLYRDAAATLAQRNSTTQQTFRLYNTYTDSSNFERLTLTGVAGTSVNIAAETMGTGGDNLDIILTPAGTGVVKLSAINDGSNFLRENLSGSGFGIGYFSSGLVIGPNNVPQLYIKANEVRASLTTAFSWSSAGWSAISDTALFRGAAGQVDVTNGTAATYRDLKLRNLLNTEYHQMTEMTAPSAPATNSLRIYAEDNGSGKTRLMALFATGAAQQLAIEP